MTTLTGLAVLVIGGGLCIGWMRLIFKWVFARAGAHQTHKNRNRMKP